MRVVPIVALTLLVATPIAVGNWTAIAITAGDQGCILPTSVYSSCLYWGLSGYVRSDACDANSTCRFSYDVQAAVSSQAPAPRTVTLALDNATRCETSGVDEWVPCRAVGTFDRQLTAGACGNAEFHVVGSYGAPPATRPAGPYGHSRYPRPDYATIVFCRNATSGDVDDLRLVRSTTLG